MKNYQLTKERLLNILNQNLKQHPDFVDDMSFDDIRILPNGAYDVRANFNFGGKSVAENYNSFGYIYNQVFNDFLA
jgi:hypothetical protein